MAARDPNSGEARTVQVVGFGLRLAAFVIDMVLVWFLGMMLGTAVGVVGMLLTMYSPDPPSLNGLIVASGLIFSVAYFVAAWSKSGQTVGKMALGIKIVGPDGKPPSGGKAVLRYLGYIVGGLALSLGFLWVALDRKRQGWHDKIAGTYVVLSDERPFNVKEVHLLSADRAPTWVWLVIWALLALTMPAALLATLLGLGLYVSELLAVLFRGG